MMLSNLLYSAKQSINKDTKASMQEIQEFQRANNLSDTQLVEVFTANEDALTGLMQTLATSEDARVVEHFDGIELVYQQEVDTYNAEIEAEEAEADAEPETRHDEYSEADHVYVEGETNDLGFTLHKQGTEIRYVKGDMNLDSEQMSELSTHLARQEHQQNQVSTKLSQGQMQEVPGGYRGVVNGEVFYANSEGEHVSEDAFYGMNVGSITSTDDTQNSWADSLPTNQQGNI